MSLVLLEPRCTLVFDTNSRKLTVVEGGSVLRALLSPWRWRAFLRPCFCPGVKELHQQSPASSGKPSLGVSSLSGGCENRVEEAKEIVAGEGSCFSAIPADLYRPTHPHPSPPWNQTWGGGGGKGFGYESALLAPLASSLCSGVQRTSCFFYAPSPKPG